MKRTLFPLLITIALSQVNLTNAAEEGFKSLFNGKDLTGWDGNPKLWSVKDGAITGQTTKENPARGNTFLIWKDGAVEDFELRLSYKIVPNNDRGFANSGIQYRSKIVNPANWVVGGYQADFEAGTTYSGILYDEANVAGGRGIMAERGQKVVWDKDCKKQVTGAVGKSEEIQAKIKKEDWNDYEVVVQGNHMVHKINGVTTVDVTDECESKRLKSGVLALQLHAGEPMTVQFKNIRIKTLSGGAAAKSDVDLLQGVWVPVEIIGNGDKASAEALANIKVTIKGNRYTVESNDGDSGSFKINESGSPKKMDVTSDGGAELPAIYELSGDTFKACYAVNGASRPTEFKSEQGSDHVLAIYKRKSN
jgi:uncharacterized protein (TIGR03067 family)